MWYLLVFTDHLQEQKCLESKDETICLLKKKFCIHTNFLLPSGQKVYFLSLFLGYGVFLCLL